MSLHDIKIGASALCVQRGLFAVIFSRETVIHTDMLHTFWRHILITYPNARDPVPSPPPPTPSTIQYNSPRHRKQLSALFLTFMWPCIVINTYNKTN